MATMIAQPRVAVGPRTGELHIEPVNRVGGGVGLDVIGDPSTGRYTNSRVSVSRFRGFEMFLSGRDVRDAIFVSSRVCGYHGGQHSVAAAQAVEMALGIEPPPAAICLRNLGLSAEMVHAEAAHLFLLAGPDFSASAIGEYWPSVWQLAVRTPAPHADIHTYKTIGDIMKCLDPLTGKWYKDAFSVARIPYEMYCALHGKYPHPETMVPGGVGCKMSHTTVSGIHDYVVRLLSLVDPAKRVAMLITDLLDFCEAAIPELAEVGVGRPNFIDSGMWDDCEGYDPTWDGLTYRGNQRWAAPGVVIDGRLVTSDLREVADGIEEDVTHSYLEPSAGRHPFDRRTVPAPSSISWDRQYSWSTSARWKGQAVETGPGARLWTTALRGRMQPNAFMSAQDGGVQLLLPDGGMPEMFLEWKPPAVWNAVERTRARLFGIVFAALNAAVQGLKLLDLQKQGRHLPAVDFDIPGDRRERHGVGFSGDGLNGHWMSLKGNVIQNYQIVGPSTFNMGPGGPLEAAIDGTPMLGEAASAKGIEALIALRSLDPCANCAGH